MLRNPVYVQADLDVYEFFKSQGTVIVNNAADFTGMNGCSLYKGRDVKPSKKNDFKDQMLVLAPHEGIVPSDIWLTCRKKLMNNMKIQSARKATHTWLSLIHISRTSVFPIAAPAALWRMWRMPAAWRFVCGFPTTFLTSPMSFAVR